MRNTFIILVGALGAAIGALSFIGLPILRALDQDVVGTMPSEVREIQVVGGVFGFIAGCYASLVLWLAMSLVVARLRMGKVGHS